VVSWLITAPTSTENYYTYEYTVKVNTTNGSVSHFEFEVSDQFGASDILGAYYATGTSSGALASSQIDTNSGFWEALWESLNLSGDPSRSVKFDVGASGTTITYTLETLRVPVWGDIFVKDGVGNVWNTGFGSDPTTATTSFTNWVPTPDTALVPLPLPALAGLASLGALGAVAWLHRRRQHRI
jgi:hypothetical protein